MAWKEDRNKRFVNPYTFIPLTGDCVRCSYQDIEKEEKLTGYIECEIETKTPIFIPNTTSDKALDFAAKGNGKSYDFYSYVDLKNGVSKEAPEPIIPGSEIRGVIRSMYEALTNSCMSSINEEASFNKRTTIPGKAGFFGMDEQGNWYIEEANTFRINTGKRQSKCSPINNFNEFNEGEKVYFQTRGSCVSRISKNKIDNTDKEGYIHRGEDFTRKKHETLFEETGKRFQLDSNDANELLHRLQYLVDLYRDNGQSKYLQFSVDNRKKMLIYYAKRNNVFYLAPAAISQEVFKNKLAQILEQQGKYNPCFVKEKVCPACLLFGMVSKETALSSRLRFSDAYVCNKQENYSSFYYEPSVLDELSSPKPSATEFYLERPMNSELWNYDYSGRWNKSTFINNGNYQPKIKGRKFYWHNNDWERNIHTLAYQKLHKRNAMVRPLKDRISFIFKVFFDGITEDELRNIVWTLNLGSNGNDHCHKIGMGKPLGLGSIKIKVNEIKERKIHLKAGKIIREYKSLNNIINQNSLPKSISLSSFEHVKKIASFHRAPKGISYPKGEEIKNGKPKSSIYLWFVGNRGGGVNPKIKYSLPEITENNQSLPVLKKIEDNNSNRNKNQQNRRK